jgi:WD40 repeat protein
MLGKQNLSFTLSCWFVVGARAIFLPQQTTAQSPVAQTLTGHQQAIQAVAFSTDGATLASAAGDRTVKLWNVKTGAL